MPPKKQSGAKPAARGGAPAPKPAAKKAPAGAKKAPGGAKKAAKPKGLTKSQLQTLLAEKLELPKTKVKEFLAELAGLVQEEVRAGRPFTLPDLVKFTLRRREAKPAREGRNPFTGEAMTIKAQPAKNVVGVRPQKALKTAIA